MRRRRLEEWPLELDWLQRQLDIAAADYAARLARGSSADSERENVLELARALGELLNEHAAGVDEPIPFRLVERHP